VESDQHFHLEVGPTPRADRIYTDANAARTAFFEAVGQRAMMVGFRVVDGNDAWFENPVMWVEMARDEEGKKRHRIQLRSCAQRHTDN
jgi:hypothetical protein